MFWTLYARAREFSLFLINLKLFSAPGYYHKSSGYKGKEYWSLTGHYYCSAFSFGCGAPRYDAKWKISFLIIVW